VLIFENSIPAVHLFLPKILRRVTKKVSESSKGITADLKLAHFPVRSPPPIAALPSMSLIPSAPFADITDGNC